ncbi:MAG TPA: hypothetical protein VE267_07890 [Bradyrhizobium sp.]|nr:hypothetical protein [Bradyrhizobium sp.]
MRTDANDAQLTIAEARDLIAGKITSQVVPFEQLANARIQYAFPPRAAIERGCSIATNSAQNRLTRDHLIAPATVLSRLFRTRMSRHRCSR